jgi:hypothetical protein
MKTTTIGRIGAIVAGAAMLGTAVASALAGAQVTVPSNLDKGFFYDSGMNPQVQVVVGEKAQASDGAAAGQIAAMIGNMALGTQTVSQSGGTVEVPGGTTTCAPGAAECAAGDAEGQVTLSWEAIGMVGELQQRQMTCDIYNGTRMAMTSLDNGGDSGTFCDGQDWTGADSSYNEVYTPEDTVGTTLVGACETGAGADVSILRSEEFANEICTICYNYCDIALGCEPHLMSEWVELACENMELEYDCDDQELKLIVKDDAIKYNVFTDDILTKDLLNEDGDLIGQSYLGKILLGQMEYYVEDVSEDEITIVCGATGTATTSAAMEYVPPAEGSACEAGDSGDTYSIRLVGAQTIEEKGVVDVTLEVTKPDGTTEQVTSGISGTPLVGDIKVKLQRGTAASNVITGEQSFSADLLVWYIPSEYTFEDGERYTEQGVQDDDGIWELEFNGNNNLYVYTISDEAWGDSLEDDGELVEGTILPDDIEENEQWDDCYDEVDADDNDTEIIRFLEFSLERESDTELPEGDMIQLPFNDGIYLLSDLKFGYQGLMNEDFLDDSMVDTTVIDIEVESINVNNKTYNDSTEGGNEAFYRKVTVDYVDQWGDSHDDVRLDEGPFEEGDLLMSCDDLVRIDKIDYNDSDEYPIIEYSIKDGNDWTEYEGEAAAGDSCGSYCGLIIDEATINATYQNVSMMSAVEGQALNMSPGWMEDVAVATGLSGIWIVRNLSSVEPDDWELWVDKDEDTVLAVAETCDTSACDCADASDVKTEFEDDVEFCAYGDLITITGATDTGGEDEITIQVNESNGPLLSINTDGCSACTLDDNDCEDIAEADEDGTLISLSGATIVVDQDEVEEPEDSNNESDIFTQVTVTVPKDELRPTIFFGIESSLNTSSIVITDADEGTVVNVGGVDVTVEDFGVTTTAGGVIVGDQATVQCPSVTGTCPDVSVDAPKANDIAYKLVVVEGAASKTNLVLMGGPSVNSMTKDLVSVDELCPDSAVVKLVGSKLVVAGCEAADTMEAADALVSWLKANV